jgi:hypothetical protein
MSVEGLTGVGTKELGLRFNVVSLLPNVTLVLFVLALNASGAPEEYPSLDRLLEAIDNVSAARLAAILALVLIASLILHPFQFSLVQLLEGYWDGTDAGRALAALLAELQRRRRQRLAWLADPGTGEEGLPRAQERLSQFPDERRLLPTRLGNTLRAAEDEAGMRYGLPTIATMPRLYPYLSERFAAVYVDRRNQLDVAVRFCAVLALATLISAAMLAVNGGRWRVLPLATALLSWTSYQAAVRAATAYGQALYVAFDLHRFDMVKALHYRLPLTLTEELAFNERLANFFIDGLPMEDDRYDHGSSDEASPV